MNKIKERFKELRKTNRKGFIAYITAGDPNLKITEQLIFALGDSGADIIELGVPFSDPMADGLTNQKAAERALASGTTLKKIFGTIKKARNKSRIPIVLFTYLNPVFRYGWERFAKDAKACGVDGVLILDLPVEESADERKILSKAGIDLIYLLSPTSSEDRIKRICKNAKGFIYYVSRTGVTGVRESIEAGVKPMVQKIKSFTDIPVGVGFGISKPEHVKEVARYADAVVVGSAIVSMIEKNIGRKNLIQHTAKFVKTLTNVL